MQARAGSPFCGVLDALGPPCLTFTFGSMSSRLNRFPVLALTTAATLLSLAGCGHSARVRYQDDLVKVTERSTINYLNVHASSDTEVLTMWGRDFKDVRGLDPCYLSVTNKHLVLFVTGKDYDGGQAIVHLADVSNRTIRHRSHQNKPIRTGGER